MVEGQHSHACKVSPLGNDVRILLAEESLQVMMPHFKATGAHTCVQLHLTVHNGCSQMMVARPCISRACYLTLQLFHCLKCTRFVTRTSGSVIRKLARY